MSRLAAHSCWVGGKPPRWPVQPLHDVLTERGLCIDHLPDSLDRAYHRGKVNGLSDRNADRAATWLGLNPVSIWTDWDAPVNAQYEMEMAG